MPLYEDKNLRFEAVLSNAGERVCYHRNFRPAVRLTAESLEESVVMPYMRHHGNRTSGGSLIGFLAGCLAGVILGAALGILMAPHRGDITRRKLARRAGETRDQVVEKVEDLMVHRREDEDVDDEENR